MKNGKNALPKIVSIEEWNKAMEKLLKEEKEHTRQRDALNARRRRLPMVKIEKAYSFQSSNGKLSLLELFEGRQQLIMYHFMFGPDWEEGCVGCSFLVDGIGNLTHLNARNTTLVLVSRAPIEKIEAFKNRMGWKIPWVSSYGSDFNFDLGVSKGKDELPGHSVFLRNKNEVFRSYFTTGRGDEYINNTFSYLDITPYGRQENWEDSPEGWPQTEPYQWWRHHDKYER